MFPFEKIKDLHYVVQRNWDTQGGDLDLFVSREDYEKLDKIVDEYELPELVDIRTEGDGYYPEEIERELLDGCRFYKGMKIPTPKAHFLSLYYHNFVHKKEGKYDKVLKYLFFEAFPPVQPNDSGVAYDSHPY